MANLDVYRLLHSCLVAAVGASDGSPMVGNIALSVAILCGIGFMIPAIRLYRTLDRKHARQLMFASFAYLPVVQLAYVLDKI